MEDERRGMLEHKDEWDWKCSASVFVQVRNYLILNFLSGINKSDETVNDTRMW